MHISQIPTHDSTLQASVFQQNTEKKQDTEFEKDVPNIISSYWSLTKPDLIFICI